MTSKFWWKLRSWWHRPSMRQEGMKPATFIHRFAYDGKVEYYLNPIYLFKWKRGEYLHIVKTFWRDLKALWHRVFWKFMWLQPLRCNGNYGGWRTELCEWLENKARIQEDSETYDDSGEINA